MKGTLSARLMMTGGVFALVGAAMFSPAFAENPPSAIDPAQPKIHSRPPLKTVPSNAMFMTLETVAGNKILSWTACGSTSASSGCYAKGQLGVFGRVCAVKGDGDMLYVADSASKVHGGSAPMAAIYAYKKTLAADGVSSSVKLLHAVTLPINGSLTAKCSIDTTGTHVYFGTNASAPVAINKATLAVASASVANGTTVGITANKDYVAISQQGGYGVIDADNNTFVSGAKTGHVFLPDGKIDNP